VTTQSREVPRLLLGGAVLEGGTRAPRDRELELAARYREPESLAVSLSKALSAGADGVLVTPSAQLDTALALLKHPVPILALLPQPSALARDAAEHGIAGAVRARGRQAGAIKRMRHALTSVTHGWAASRQDLAGLVPLLLELEAPRQRDLRGIVLSDRITDLALAGKHRHFFEVYARFVRSRFGGLAGLETRNLGHLLRALHEWGIAIDVVVGPVNPDGVAMKPSRGEVLAELARATVPVLAKELRGGGTTSLVEGARFARAHGAYGLVADLVDLEDLGAELRALKALDGVSATA